MIDLTNPGSDAAAGFTSLKVSRDGTANAGLIYVLTLTFDVLGSDDARVLDGALRGALAYYESVHDTEERGSFKRVPLDLVGRLLVTFPDAAATLCDAAQAEVVSLALRKGAKASAVAVQFRIRTLDHHAAGDLLAYLGRTVAVRWEVARQQQQLPFAVPAATNAVRVVSALRGDPGNGGTYFFGVQVAEADGQVVLDDFGVEHRVLPDEVLSANIVVPEAGAAGPSLSEVVEPYAQQIRDLGAVPSWRHVIVGLVAARGLDVTGDGIYRLTPADLDAAVVAAAEELSGPAN